MAAALVEINDLCFSYRAQEVLHHINLTVEEGDFVSIIGPNGGGKSTLLKLILGLLSPSRGTVRIKGRPPRAAMASIGYMPQHFNHHHHFPATALDIVLMGCHDPRQRLRFGAGKQRRRQGMAVLERLGVADFAGRRIADLSGGQRQRILIARALVSQPELLILDEPTSNIDTKGQTELYQLLQELNQELTIITVSHNLFIVSSYAKSIACLNRRLHYHKSFTSSSEVLDAYYSCSVEEVCPVAMVSQGSGPDRGEQP